MQGFNACFDFSPIKSLGVYEALALLVFHISMSAFTEAVQMAKIMHEYGYPRARRFSNIYEVTLEIYQNY